MSKFTQSTLSDDEKYFFGLRDEDTCKVKNLMVLDHIEESG